MIFKLKISPSNFVQKKQVCVCFRLIVLLLIRRGLSRLNTQLRKIIRYWEKVLHLAFSASYLDLTCLQIAARG